MEGRYSLAVVIVVSAYAAVLGAYVGRALLRRTIQLDALQGRVWELEATQRGMVGTFKPGTGGVLRKAAKAVPA